MSELLATIAVKAPKSPPPWADYYGDYIFWGCS